MAILYGTQSNGETLPVEVIEFGHLVAKGIAGTTGPPGPPGVGELPPDPFEGAILGWENNALAWLGGVVPLPEYTFGPFVYSESEGTLTVPQDVSILVNGQQLIQSDMEGNPLSSVAVTDDISNVKPPDPVIPASIQGPGAYNGGNGPDACQKGVAGGGGFTQVNGANYETVLVFDFAGVPESITQNLKVFINQSTSTYLMGVNYTDGSSVSKTWQSWLTEAAQGENTFVDISNGKTVLQVRDTRGDGTIIKQGAFGVNNVPYNSSSTDQVLSFPTASNFDKFEVGDVVQGVDIQITDIDANTAPPTIAVSGGDWLGSDGSGVPDGGTYLSAITTGTGTVQTAQAQTISLQENNNEWVNGFYVTAPEQQIAARKVAVSAVKRNTKRDELR